MMKNLKALVSLTPPDNRRIMAVDVFEKTCAKFVSADVLADAQVAKKWAIGLADFSDFNAARERCFNAWVESDGQGDNIELAHEAAYDCFRGGLKDCLYSVAGLCWAAAGKTSAAEKAIEKILAQ